MRESRSLGQWFFRLVSTVLLVLAASLSLSPRASASAAPSIVYFPQTGHHVSEPFLSFWLQHGGIRIFGYPVSEPVVDAASGLTVQYFERARFEHHPGCGPSCGVLLTRVGAVLTQGRTEPAFAPLVLDPSANSAPDRRYFPETGHTLAYGFKRFWEQHGGLAVFGFPISEEFTEVDATGQAFTVQYFERARFEWHPELAGTPYEVQLGLLGASLALREGIATDPVGRQEGVAEYSPELFKRGFRMPILMYHQVGEPAGRYRIPLWKFEQQLDWLLAHGYTTITMSQMFDALLRGGPLPERPVAITFDDGSPGQWQAAMALNARGMVATFFVVPGRSGLSDEQIRALAEQGHEIGSHSLHHPNLRLVPDGQLWAEVSLSKARLEEITGRPIRYFAYPGGEYDARVIAAVQAAGYDGALAAWGGTRCSPERRWAEPRVEVSGLISLEQFGWYVEQF
ncbi:polysaccharide deacetylase family protein [Thermomicrobiaceae bacterium CFH 74404]|uniref:Polysaccharide deacetylase family protein n=1 Tax=Thermalbibacter longus TaxID=2951981 RepID=A0AA41WAY0_9BACT|nr:polysaccharide deacetylase family protein [Thermalbibacter longus]MCM8749127.1 polysaccharide deacetylase family protein [Thermalbibacter longus]